MEFSNDQIRFIRRGRLNDRMALPPEVLILSTVTPLLMSPFLIVFARHWWSWFGFAIAAIGFVYPIVAWFMEHPKFELILSKGKCETVRLEGGKRGEVTEIPLENFETVVVRYSLEADREVTGSREVAFYDTRLKHLTDPSQDVVLEHFYDRNRSEWLAEAAARLLDKPIFYEKMAERAANPAADKKAPPAVPSWEWINQTMLGFAELILGMVVLSFAFTHLDNGVKIIRVTGTPGSIWIEILETLIAGVAGFAAVRAGYGVLRARGKTG